MYRVVASFFFFNMEEPREGKIEDKCDQRVVNEAKWLEGQREISMEGINSVTKDRPREINQTIFPLNWDS